MYLFTENEISTRSDINFSRVYHCFIFVYSYLVILESKAFQQLNILKDLCELSGCFWYLSFLNILWLHCLYIRKLCRWCSINTNLTHFIPELHFIQKPILSSAVHIKWLVCVWNARLGWNGWRVYFPASTF